MERLMLVVGQCAKHITRQNKYQFPRKPHGHWKSRDFPDGGKTVLTRCAMSELGVTSAAEVISMLTVLAAKATTR